MRQNKICKQYPDSTKNTLIRPDPDFQLRSYWFVGKFSGVSFASARTYLFSVLKKYLDGSSRDIFDLGVLHTPISFSCFYR
jgi:hypothetical protein